MNLLLALVPLLAVQDKKLDVEHTKLLVYDAAREMTLRVSDDGRVDLTIAEDDKDAGGKVKRTYSAPSVDEFRKKHPEAVRRHDLDRFLDARPLAEDEFEKWWGRFKRQAPGFRRPGQGPFDEDLQKFMEEQRELYEQLRRRILPPGQDPAPVPPGLDRPEQGREFGVKVEAIGETLRDQLSLKEDEGVIVSEVKPGSAAEKAGVKRHDIVLKLDGKPVTDRWQFRADLLTAMGKPSFELEILRSGKREKLNMIK